MKVTGRKVALKGHDVAVAQVYLAYALPIRLCGCLRQRCKPELLQIAEGKAYLGSI